MALYSDRLDRRQAFLEFSLQSSIEICFLRSFSLNHIRVIPRDFFNEAKLLKCLGHLELLILEKKIQLRSEFDGKNFNIEQSFGDGSLRCSNYRVFFKDEEIYLYTQYNSKENFPLILVYRMEDYYVFDENGKFMPGFIRS